MLHGPASYESQTQHHQQPDPAPLTMSFGRCSDTQTQRGAGWCYLAARCSEYAGEHLGHWGTCVTHIRRLMRVVAALCTIASLMSYIRLAMFKTVGVVRSVGWLRTRSAPRGFRSVSAGRFRIVLPYVEDAHGPAAGGYTCRYMKCSMRGCGAKPCDGKSRRPQVSVAQRLWCPCENASESESAPGSGGFPHTEIHLRA